jgi:hypothetical protein
LSDSNYLSAAPSDEVLLAILAGRFGDSTKEPTSNAAQRAAALVTAAGKTMRYAIEADDNPTAISSLICDEIWFTAWDH